MAYQKTNNRKPVSHSGRIKHALQCAERTLETVKKGLAQMGVPENQITQHPMYVDAATPLNYLRDTVEYFGNPMTAAASAAPQSVSGKKASTEPRQKPRQFLQIGQMVVGRVTRDWTEGGFTFAVPTHTVLADGTSEKLIELHVDVFMHRSEVSDAAQRDAIAKGDEVLFSIVAGRKEGQLAAGDISLVPAEDEKQSSETETNAEETETGPMAKALQPLAAASDEAISDVSEVVEFKRRQRQA